MLIAALPARGQPAAPTLPPGRAVAITDVQFGWNGALVPERWNPIRVFLTGGSKGFSGALIAEFNQDGSQAARVITPAAATPGRTTPIDIAAAIPYQCARIEFSLVDDSGAVAERVVYDRLPGPREQNFGPTWVLDGGLLVAVGPGSISTAFDPPGTPKAAPTAAPDPGPPPIPPIEPEAAEGIEVVETVEDLGIDTPPEPPPSRRAWTDLRVARVEADALPMLWTAYDAARALIIRAESMGSVDPRVVDAIRAWVASGGRLVLIVDQPGASWRRWLPNGPAGEVVTVGEVERLELPGELATAVGEVADTRPASAVQGRALSLTPHGRGQAWSLGWTAGEGESRGLLAQGPVGFGWVTIVGVEPQACAMPVSGPASAAVWHAVLDRPLDAWLSQPPDIELSYIEFTGAMSGATAKGRQALSQLLSQLIDAAPIGVGVVIAILAGMLLLTALVGPFDALALKWLRLRQHSWLTALGWITILSIAAYIFPPMLRTGPTVVHRLAGVDVLVDPDAPPGRGPAWSSALSTIFASEAGPVPLEPFAGGTWWRGVSSSMSRPDTRRLLPPLPLRIDTGGPGGQELRGAVPAGLFQSQWTFRSVADDGPARDAISARVRRDDDGWDVTLIGVPPDARIGPGELAIGEETFMVAWENASIPASAQALRTWRGRSAPMGAEPAAAPADPPPGEEALVERDGVKMAAGAAASPATFRRYNPDDVLPETVLALAGPADRELAARARVESGRWARLQLRLSGLPPAYPGLTGSLQTSTVVYRLLIPLDDQEPR